MTLAPPDLSKRPYTLQVERVMCASADALYLAWTEEFDSWFAAAGTLSMNPEVDALFFFETHFDGRRHPHYGRFLELEPGRRIVMTWVTGDPGTGGAETVLSIELEEQEEGTLLTLSHTGFYNEASRDGHEEAWPEGLAHLDECLARKGN